jgi:NDP-sugar pyrophosphorylase family protein
MSRRAIILAGGKGTRLKPYTVALPKPLVPIHELPILEIIIKQLSSQGFTHITITVNHLSELIKAFFGDGSKWGLTIDYSLEKQPLSTMGPLTLIEKLPDNFLVLNGDVLTDLKFDDFLDLHSKNGSIFTIASYSRIEKSEYGVLEINNKHELVNFFEKPERLLPVSMGVYAVSKDVLNYIPKNTFFGFDHLMLELINTDRKPIVHPFSGYWMDIGRPSDYEQATDDFETMRGSLLPDE